MELVELKKEEFKKFTHENNAHFLQSYEWGQMMEYRKNKVYYVGLKENNNVLATALLIKKQLPFNYSWFYIPRGYVIDYNNYDLLKTFTKKLSIFLKKYKAIFIKIDPDIKLHTIDECARVVDGENNYKLVDDLKKIGFKRKKLNKFFENEQPRFTFRVTLDDEESIDKRYSKTVHRFIKKANNYHVEVYKGKKSDIDSFIRLMKLTEKRQNFFSHEYEYYKEFYKIFSEDNHVDIMLAKINIKKILDMLNKKISDGNDTLVEEKNFFEDKLKVQDEVIVSSYFTVYYGNKAWYLYGANDLDYKMTYANYKLFDFQIKESLKRNKKIFDEFGTIGDPKTTNKLLGLHEFKKKFGGEYVEFIGEFDYIKKPLLYFFFKLIVPFRRYITKKRLHKKVQKY